MTWEGMPARSNEEVGDLNVIGDLLVTGTGGTETGTYVGDKIVTGTLTVGTTAAASGAIRMENNASISARNHADDGDIALIKLTTNNNIDINHPDSGRIRLEGNGSTVINGFDAAYILIDPTNEVDVLGGSAGTAGLVIATDGSISLTPDAGKVITAGPIILPSVDPEILGALWNDSGTPAISAGPP